MGLSLEQRIGRIETELKALKAIYEISGSAVKTSLSSDIIATDPNMPGVNIKFTPSYGNVGEITIYSVYAYEQSGVEWVSTPAYLLPQEEGGDIIANLPQATAGNTYKIEISASVPGTFTQIV